MSVLIKGMEMPINCHSCPMCLMRFCQAGDMELSEQEARPNAKRPDDCPLIELPLHGRLIDADALAKQGWTISRTYSASPTEMVYEVRKMTDEVLPTIIEAEDNTDFFTKGHLHLGYAEEGER